MKIITIEAKKTKNISKEEWENHLNEIAKQVGCSPSHVFGIGHKMEYVWHNGWLYYRRYYLSVPSEADSHFIRFDRDDIKPKDGAVTNPPDVLCECGTTEFTLRYGHYEINAQCMKCGKEATVYDG